MSDRHTDWHNLAACIRSGQIDHADVMSIMRDDVAFAAWYRGTYCAPNVPALVPTTRVERIKRVVARFTPTAETKLMEHIQAAVRKIWRR